MENKFAKALLAEENTTTTTNGDKALKSTTSKILDFFSKAGAIRTVSDSEKIALFNAAYSEDKLLALKALFFIRDIRGGAGERDTFRVIAKSLCGRDPLVVKKNIELFSEYGRWDDLFVLFGTSIEEDALNLIQKQLLKDISTNPNESISLLSKWLPSENASSKKTRSIAYKIINFLGISPRQYRKTLSKLRAHIDIVEENMSSRNWEEIVYPNVPSRASMIYRKAFKKHDNDRYSQYLDDVKNGKATINTVGINPYELVYKSKHISDETIEMQWKSLPLYLASGLKAIGMCDISESMDDAKISNKSQATGRDVSIAMGIYLAEKLEGPFNNLLLTFSRQPTLVKLTGETLHDKIKQIPKYYENTNLMAAFDLLLKVAVENNVPKEDMLDVVFIFSDMQFDNCCNYGLSTYQASKKKFNAYGYKLPHVVFWNLAAKLNNSPVDKDEIGTTLVSGFSAQLFKSVLLGNTPYENMVKTLNSSRYNKVSI